VAELDALRAPVLAIARSAGEAILAVYGEDFEVRHKADRSPVTDADMAAHRIIVDGLRALTPQWPVLSEESAAIPAAERRAWSRYWLVDPLDGTREFVKRNGEFTVNIALIDYARPVFGVLHAPALDETASAVVGGSLEVTRNGVSVPRTLARDRPPRIAGSRSHQDRRLDRALARLGEHTLVGIGSALKFIRVALGEVDLYVRLGSTSEWDTAAGQCLVECVGGAVTDLAGVTLDYNRRDSVINPSFIASADRQLPWLERMALGESR